MAHASRTDPWFRFWAPRRLTWLVAILFIIGSGLFTLGGYGASFPPDLPRSLSEPLVLNWIFFSGSGFF
jgi:hypothetical protein